MEIMEMETLITQLGRIGKTSDGRPAPYGLARLAGVSDPETLISPGAMFLVDTFNSWLERVSFDLRDVVRTLDADAINAINRDTATIHEGYSEFTCWKVFTDLALSHDDAIDEWAGPVARKLCGELSETVIGQTLAISIAGAARMTVEAVAWRLSQTLCELMETIARKGGR